MLLTGHTLPDLGLLERPNWPVEMQSEGGGNAHILLRSRGRIIFMQPVLSSVRCSAKKSGPEPTRGSFCSRERPPIITGHLEVGCAFRLLECTRATCQSRTISPSVVRRPQGVKASNRSWAMPVKRGVQWCSGKSETGTRYLSRSSLVNSRLGFG